MHQQIPYPNETCIDFVARAMCNNRYTLDAALYSWYVEVYGWEKAQCYSYLYITGVWM